VIGRLLAATLPLLAVLFGSPLPTNAASRPLVMAAHKIPIPSGHNLRPVALNDEGQALMASSKCADCATAYYYWSGRYATKIGSPPGITDFQPYALDDEGWFAGDGLATTGTADVVESFVGHMSKGIASFTPLLGPRGGRPGILALAMNANGDVLGQSAATPPVYFLWTSGAQRAQALRLPAPAGATAAVTSLDDEGDFAGIAQSAVGEQAVVWLPGKQVMILPGSSVGDDGGSPLSIGGFAASPNNTTLYVTAYRPPLGTTGLGTATYWTVSRQTWAHPAEASLPVVVGTLSKNDQSSVATGVSPDGWVVGNSLGPQSGRAFLYHDGNLSPLRRFVTGRPKPPAAAFTGTPVAINAHDQILLGDWIFTPRA
jgi:hypothetical protein